MAYQAQRVRELEALHDKAQSEVDVSYDLLERKHPHLEAAAKRWAAATVEYERIDQELAEAQNEHRDQAEIRQCECPEHRQMSDRAGAIGQMAYDWMVHSRVLITLDTTNRLFDQLEPGGTLDQRVGWLPEAVPAGKD